MIGRLTGAAVETGADGCCVLDVGGVGYEVFVPLRSLHVLPRPPAVATLHVHTHVREEALTLFGFVEARDREIFRLLLGVSGVGPRLAMAILSDLSADELATAVARGDKKRLNAVAGVGAKTAARLALELRDKLPAPRVNGSALVQNEASLPAGDVPSKVADALVGLGFTQAQAQAAVAKVARDDDGRPVEVVLRQALATLG